MVWLGMNISIRECNFQWWSRSRESQWSERHLLESLLFAYHQLQPIQFAVLLCFLFISFLVLIPGTHKSISSSVSTSAANHYCSLFSQSTKKEHSCHYTPLLMTWTMLYSSQSPTPPLHWLLHTIPHWLSGWADADYFWWCGNIKMLSSKRWNMVSDGRRMKQ